MIPPDFRCPRRIGFLFPHECGKLTPIGCTDCNDGQLADPFRQRTDRHGYSDYDDYSGTGADDFTEADGENLVRRKRRFEEDMSAS